MLDDLTTIGYPVGTFSLGQKVYKITNRVHRFHFHKKCILCDDTGFVSIKGREFKCPACNNEYIHKEVIEWIIENDYDVQVESIISLKNRNGTYEIYTTDSNGLGLQITKKRDGTNTYFGTKEEAQAACDKFNKENNVELYLDEYKRAELKGCL